MAKRRIRLDLDIDDRTEALTNEALICRGSGHSWERRAMSRRRTEELAQQGLMEFDRFCTNKCGSTWRQLWDVRNRVLLENERDYPKNGAYRLPKGSGRLSRADAVPALFAREHPGLV